MRLFQSRLFQPLRRGWHAVTLAVFAASSIAASPTMQSMTTMPGSSYRGPLPKLTEAQRDLSKRLKAHVVAIGSHEHNIEHPARLEAAAKYIEQALQAHGHAVHSQHFISGGVPVRNLEVRLKGLASAASASSSMQASRAVIVVGAHYDSAVGSPGANDNATGTAAVIELARMLRHAPWPAEWEIRLVLFVNEEAPHFKTEQMGSWVHAKAMKERGESVAAMLSLETLGYYSDQPGSQKYPPPLDRFYPDTGNFIGFVGDTGARPLVERAIASFRRQASFPSEGVAAPTSFPGIDWSDHWAYRQFGYPAIMVTDTAPYRYPFYHTRNDLPDKVDYERLARVVDGIAKVIPDLAAP